MSDPKQFSSPSTFFTADHRECDALWSAFEAVVDRGDDAAANTAWVAFRAAMLRHFAFEEDVLFPAFEAATGMTQGPTAVMRMEHTQMRGLMEEMQRAAASGDFEAVADHGDTLLMLTQQHNVKEERMLYPMTDRVMGAGWDGLVAQLEDHPKR